MQLNLGCSSRCHSAGTAASIAVYLLWACSPQIQAKAPTTLDISTSPAAIRLDANEVGDATGGTGASCDVNGDGIQDLILGADLADGPDNQRPASGTVYIVYGRRGSWERASLLFERADVRIFGQDPYDHFGAGIACGDVNADGYGDALVCAFNANGPSNSRIQSGQAHLILGGPSLPADIDLAVTPQITIYGPRPDYRVCMIPAIGDINGDGIGDLLLDAGGGRDSAGVHQTGRAYALFGRSSWPSELDAEGDADVVVIGRTLLDALGSDLEVADLDRDGIGEMIVGARLGDGPTDQRTDAGEIYVFRGRSSWPTTLDMASVVPDMWLYGPGTGTASFQRFSVGDVQGDGWPDILADLPGAPGPQLDAPLTGEVRGYQPGPVWAPEVDLGSDHDWVVYGADAGDYFSGTRAIGDVSGDGQDDLIGTGVWADGPNESRPDAGEIAIVIGRDPFPSQLDTGRGEEDLHLYEPLPGDEGSAVISGDFNGDGVDDLIVSSGINTTDRVPVVWIISPVDLDGDRIPALPDNCPSVFNPEQVDTDGDRIGDPCDPDAGFDPSDPDGDGVANAQDNCPMRFNPRQTDADSDGVGNVCDNCGGASNPDQQDWDGDGAGDACDCQGEDLNDRAGGDVVLLQLERVGGASSRLSWSTAAGADSYAVTRGTLGSLPTGSLGGCWVPRTVMAAVEDPEVPAPGQGFCYLVQAQNDDCGLGGLGYSSGEVTRVNPDPSACPTAPRIDALAVSESTVYGQRAGSLDHTRVSDDAAETLTEVLSGGNPDRRYSRLDHRWSFNVSPGAEVALHVEGLRVRSTDGDNFLFEYSTDGGVVFNPIPLSFLPLRDQDVDLVGALPGVLSGSVIVRVVDTDRTEGHQTLDSVSIDQLFVRTNP